MEQKEVALSVSKAILNGEWQKLDVILDDGFTYTGDGMHFNKQQYIDFMKGMKAAFTPAISWVRRLRIKIWRSAAISCARFRAIR